ncbi:MAG: virulence protein RhuM/Fic/DOC family protein [Bacteroidota bacterium]
MENVEIKIYTTEDGKTTIEVRLEKETVWLTQSQLAQLFQTERSVINKHILNIYNTGELDEKATCAKIAQVQSEGSRKVTRKINHYNLDVIIAVGYRVNSRRGTQFRIWANKIIKEYLIKGYALNMSKLQKQTEQLTDLKKVLNLLNNISRQKCLTNNEFEGLLNIVTNYANAFDILDKYDHQTITIDKTTKNELYRISYHEAISQIQFIKSKYGYPPLFGKEKDQSFHSSIKTIYQTFNGTDLYPSVEEKAAHLLYFIVKNHSFVDGNKRIAAILFLYFLEKNNLLYDDYGNKRIADNALVAITLMIAISMPEEKDLLIKVIVNLINKNN